MRISLPETPEFAAQKATVEAIVRPEPESDSDDTYVLRLDSGSAKEFDFPSLHGIVHPEITSADHTSAEQNSSLPY